MQKVNRGSFNEMNRLQICDVNTQKEVESEFNNNEKLNSSFLKRDDGNIF